MKFIQAKTIISGYAEDNQPQKLVSNKKRNIKMNNKINLKIREYKNEDMNNMISVWKNSSKYVHSFLTDEQMNREEKEIKEVFIPIVNTWIAEMDGKFVGFISLIRNNIGGLFVDPDYQRIGVGTELVNFAKESHSILEVDVFEKNSQGRNFYSKTGFVFESMFIYENTNENTLHLTLNNGFKVDCL